MRSMRSIIERDGRACGAWRGTWGCLTPRCRRRFSSQALPSWGTLELLVEAMGGDVAEFHDLWLAASTPAGGLERPALAIAGRQSELAAVRRHLQSGAGVLLVTGEAGIGKTTLVGAAAESVDTFVAVGRCLQLSREVPLLPVVDALRALLKAEDGQWMKDGLADCPVYVRTSLGLLLPELDAAGPAPPVDDPWGLEKLFASVTSILAALATTRPVALLIEDCHWADRSTLDLLSHLASAPPPVPLVLTWRSADPDVSSGHTEWLSRMRWTSGIPALDLKPLTLEETAQQLRLLSGSECRCRCRGAHPGALAGPPVVHRAAGVGPGPRRPAATARGSARPADRRPRRWRVARRAGARPGSTAGRTEPVARSAAAWTLTLRPTDCGLWPGEDSARGDTSGDAELSHPLFVDAIHRRLLPGEGTQVHARLAQALSEEPGIEPAEVADHWQAAGRPDLEVSHRVAAASRAGARFAYREALDAWLRVLEAVGRRHDHGRGGAVGRPRAGSRGGG